MSRLTIFFLLIASLPLFGISDGPAFVGLHNIESEPYAKTSKVLEIRGEHGSPMPSEWMILLSDTSARGGVREITVADGKITSERTPLRGAIETANLQPIESSELSFDADKVFKIVQREAEKNEVGFHWIDYTLRMDTESNAPVWNVKIYDHMGAAIGNMRISAQGGTIVRSLQLDSDSRSHAETTPSNNRVGGIVGAVGNTVNRTAKKTKDSTLRFIGTVQEVFVGERTIGPKEE